LLRLAASEYLQQAPSRGSRRWRLSGLRARFVFRSLAWRELGRNLRHRTGWCAWGHWPSATQARPAGTIRAESLREALVGGALRGPWGPTLRRCHRWPGAPHWERSIAETGLGRIPPIANKNWKFGAMPGMEPRPKARGGLPKLPGWRSAASLHGRNFPRFPCWGGTRSKAPWPRAAGESRREGLEAARAARAAYGRIEKGCRCSNSALDRGRFERNRDEGLSQFAALEEDRRALAPLIPPCTGKPR